MYTTKRPAPMAIAALVLSILGICASCCFYAAIPLSALSMIFALLSKGGSQSMDPTARTAFITALIAMFFTIVLTVSAFLMAILQYGSLDAFLNAYKELYDSYYSTFAQ